MKFKEYFNQILKKENQILWLMLAMHAGYLNAGGFLACHRFVSHMTGFGTQIGVSIGQGDLSIALEMMLGPLVFVIGAASAGFMMDRKLVNGRKPKLVQGMLLITLFDALVWIGGISGFFGDFGEPIVHQRDFLLLFMLIYNCGLQNGLFVTLTSGQVRTTHITGMATDLGLYAVKILSIKKGTTGRGELLNKNFLRLKTMIAFSFGSLISAIIFQRLQYWGFFVSFSFSLVILIYIQYTIKFLIGVDPR